MSLQSKLYVMKRSILAVLCLVLATALVFGADAFSEPIYVGRGDTCGGNTPCYSSIQQAINDADTGDSIKSEQGNYDEDVTVNEGKELTFQSGYNSTFSGISSRSTVSTLTIDDGLVIIEEGSLGLGTERLNLEYTVTLDCPTYQANHVDVNLSIEGNTESDVYLMFCSYQNINLKQNTTAEAAEDINIISAKDLNGSNLPIYLVDNPDLGSQEGWNNSRFYKIETGGATSFTVSYVKAFEIAVDYPYYYLFLVPVYPSINQIKVSFQVPSGYRVIAP